MAMQLTSTKFFMLRTTTSMIFRTKLHTSFDSSVFELSLSNNCHSVMIFQWRSPKYASSRVTYSQGKAQAVDPKCLGLRHLENELGHGGRARVYKELLHLLPFFLTARQEEGIRFFITRHGTMDEARSHNLSFKNKISFHFFRHVLLCGQADSRLKYDIMCHNKVHVLCHIIIECHNKVHVLCHIIIECQSKVHLLCHTIIECHNKVHLLCHTIIECYNQVHV